MNKFSIPACATESESGIIVNHNEKSRLCTEYYLRGVHLDERSLWTCSSCYLLLATWNNCCFSTVMAVSRKFQSVLFVCGQTWESTVPKEEELLEHFMCEYEKACTWCGTFKLKSYIFPIISKKLTYRVEILIPIRVSLAN